MAAQFVFSTPLATEKRLEDHNTGSPKRSPDGPQIICPQCQDWVVERRMSGLTQDGTPEPVSRDQILRREHGEANSISLFSFAQDNRQGLFLFFLSLYRWPLVGAETIPVDAMSGERHDDTYTHNSA